MSRATTPPAEDDPPQRWRPRMMLALRIAGPLLFVALLVWFVDPRDVARTLGNADPLWLGLCVLAFHVVTLLRVARWVVVHAVFGLRPAPWLYHVRLSYATALAALIVPQFISPFARFAMLVQDGQPRLRSAGASLAEKFGELFAYAAAGLIGGCYFVAVLGGPWWAIAAIGAAAAVAACAWPLYGALQPLLSWTMNRVRQTLGEETVDELNVIVARNRRREFVLAAVLSLAIAMSQAAAAYFAVRAVGIDLPFTFVAAAWGLVALTMLLPLSVNGIGTREGVYVALFATRDIPAEAAFSAAVVVVAAALVAAAPGALEWVYRLTLPRRPLVGVDAIAADAHVRSA